jgi:hypothetical protein
MPWLYPWAAADPSASALQEVYLTPWFFAARTIIYFVVWTALALWVRRGWGDLARMIRTASAGLIVYALTASFAGIDWIGSLTPTFHSSIYGLLLITFQLLAGLAFALVIALRPSRARPTFSYGPILVVRAVAVGLHPRDAIHHHLGWRHSRRGHLVFAPIERWLGHRALGAGPPAVRRSVLRDAVGACEYAMANGHS